MDQKIPYLGAKIRKLNQGLKKGAVQMKVTITKQCMGDRNCNDLCPEVFEYDEDQLISTIKMDEIPEHLKDIVRRAASECGADAIIIEE
jgi:ferredoxin